MRAAILLFLGLFAGLTPGQASAEKRVALVIGNGDYQNVTKLPNPANDARAIAALLQSAGFEVISGVDLKRDEMVSRIGQFGDSVRAGAEAAVVFYAGHGVQIAGKNYLIPIDADLHSAYDVKVRTVDADDIVDNASDAKVKLVLLDACRDNPFAEQLARGDAKSRGVAGNSGLAAMQSAEGTMISFATSPGAAAIDGAGDHSPFTKALLDNLAAPGVEINDAMLNVCAEVQAETDKKQLPWANTNMTGKFFVVPAGPPPAAPSGSATPAVSPTGVSDAQAIETTFWQSAQASGRRQEYLLYLSKYPKGKGIYSDLAEMRLAELDQGVAPGGDGLAARPGAGPEPKPDLAALKNEDATKATEDSLALDNGRWRDLQGRLTALGFATGGVDGFPGEGTHRALANWQTSRGYKVSGYLNKPQLDALLLEAAPAGLAAAAPPLARSAAPTHRQARVYAPRPANGPGPGAIFQGIGIGVGQALGCRLMGC